MFEGVADVSWQDKGACLQLEDPSVMFPAGYVDTEALRACATCPVFTRCREWIDQIETGLSRDMVGGFVAGETASQRVERRRQEAGGRRPPTLGARKIAAHA